MWTLERMRQVALDRGETAEADKVVGVLLLAHERFRGRTEEHYPREMAGQELERLLEKEAGPLPAVSVHEFGGLRQLRAFADGRFRQRASEKQAVVKAEQPKAVVEAVRKYERDDDADADRG